MSRRSISQEKAAFLRYELDNGDDRRRKIALQELARSYRAGEKLSPDARNGIELTVNGLIAATQNEKVIRWCLNCVAQLGTRTGSLSTVERALSQYDGNPEIIAAAVAAASRLYSGNLDECPALDSVNPTIKTLAALQVTKPSKLDLSGFKINVDTVDAEVLKLALIAVGLNRAFENMFHPKFSNGQLVKELCTYDDVIVKQYSVWAIIENPTLHLSDLGIPFHQIEREPSNVQSKLLELAAEQHSNIKEKHEIILKGTYLQDMYAREGLAKGLKNQFYDGLQDITLNWFDTESSFRVRELIAEHFSRFAKDCHQYEDKTFELLEREPKLKKRLYLGAEGTALFGKLKANDLRAGTGDLFAGDNDPLTTQLRKTGNLPMKKVLMLCASPKDEQPLRLGQEARDLKEQLRLVENRKTDIEIAHAWAVKTDQVQVELLNNKPDILHFSGHGATGLLCFEDRNGNTAPVSAEAIEGLVKQCDGLECLILNACHSEEIALKTSPHLKAVIGCADSISDEAAIIFTKSFYRALAHGFRYQRAFELALNQLQIENLTEEAKKYKYHC